MKSTRSFVVLLASLALITFVAAPAVAQTHSAEHRVVAHYQDSGVFANPGTDEKVVFSTMVESPGAEWLRLNFRRADLGVGTYVRLTSLRDGATQHLGQMQMDQWQRTSAYFNGSAVLLDLVAGPGTASNSIEIGDIWAGTIPRTPLSQCGPSDDRVPSEEPERARLLNIGCTAWMYNEDSCFATAGHCVSGSGANVVQFNVPPSNSNGSINHPPPADQYPVDTSNIPGVNGGVGNDWGIFRVFPNSETGKMPHEVQGAHLTIASSLPQANDTINVVGYGVDSGVRNQTQQYSNGPVFSSSQTTIRHRSDTQGGNSGSGIVWEATGEAVAIHTHGGCTSGGGSNAGTAVTHTGFQAALENFCPAGGGGGGGVPCGEIHVFGAFCRGSGAKRFILTGVLMKDANYTGKSVMLDVDGKLYEATVKSNMIGKVEVPGITAGQHVVKLVDPASCAPPKTIVCQ